MASDDSTYSLTLARIKGFLEPHGDLRVEETADKFRVLKTDEDGYDVCLEDWTNEVSVGGSEYHEHHGDPEQAAACFIGMLTPSYRYVVTYRNGKVKNSRLERNEDSQWVSIGQYVAMFPLFGKDEERVLRNHHLPAP